MYLRIAISLKLINRQGLGSKYKIAKEALDMMKKDDLGWKDVELEDWYNVPTLEKNKLIKFK